jgi:hypothetical protein
VEGALAERRQGRGQLVDVEPLEGRFSYSHLMPDRLVAVCHSRESGNPGLDAVFMIEHIREQSLTIRHASCH